MLILSVESSCDETAVAVTRDGREVLSDAVFSQADMHALYGGVVPEIASRNHVKVISGLADEAVRRAGIEKADVGAVAATYAPGLIGALLVGLSFAKGASLALGVPFIPVHHLRGHIAANYLAFPELEPPFLAAVVSGGNTVIAAVRGYTGFEIIGATRDDAAGECFDKTARALGLGYPGGKILDELSRSGDAEKYALPRPVIDGKPFDMSFSGLKTAVVNLIHNAEQRGETPDLPSVAAGVCAAVADILAPRIIAAAETYGFDKIAVAGGVAANSAVRGRLTDETSKRGLALYLPPLSLCGDNAAMIGSQAYYEFLAGNTADMSANAYATMAIDDVQSGRGER
ncbi:MAG: tRNA (adenosine(37)-N6)-threonylcarbamoyltransferase complex transferase subunit TsaD [Oscillospiraceae bacterium]|jgi:N6-L-threonylcarbamoyladenine synthase|nr:tRNA (adenosine(37)-N6)-threonylcarbamoyltransferase complex transferase subunit TsaD [Oscillospiraceae bacterium]